jgi:hypothetical protein
MIGSKEFAWCSAEPFARGRTMHAQFQVCNLNTAISRPEGVMSQYSTLARNGPGRRREDLAQRTPRNAGMSWGEPKVPARGGHVSIFNIGAQRTGEKKRRPRAEDAEEPRDERYG